MHDLRRRLQSLILLASLAIPIALAGPALADPRMAPGGEGLGMIGYVIDDVDAAAGTLVVSGETYHVDARSVLQDAAGNRIALGALRGMASHGVADMVKIESTRNGRGGRAVVRELSIVDLGRP